MIAMRERGGLSPQVCAQEWQLDRSNRFFFALAGRRWRDTSRGQRVDKFLHEKYGSQYNITRPCGNSELVKVPTSLIIFKRASDKSRWFSCCCYLFLFFDLVESIGRSRHTTPRRSAKWAVQLSVVSSVSPARRRGARSRHWPGWCHCPAASTPGHKWPATKVRSQQLRRPFCVQVRSLSTDLAHHQGKTTTTTTTTILRTGNITVDKPGPSPR